MKSDGKCKIDSAFIGELTADLLGDRPILSAKYGLSSSTTYERFGSGNRNVWSEETLKKLDDLVESMERDVLKDLFEGDTTTGSSPSTAPTTIESVSQL